MLRQGEPVQLVDVRSATEFKTGHIPGAINIPMEEVEGRLGDIAKSQTIVMVCQGGVRAHVAAKCLEAREIDCIVLQGGTNAWKAAGRPVLATGRVRWSLERQVRLGAGLLVLSGVLLAVLISPYWIGLSGFVGLGLTFAGLTDFCPMALFLAKMPWNGSSRQATVSAVTDGQACSLRQ
jgi:rhodanese-related sulfurtransferase